MGADKHATVVLAPDLHERLVRLAEREGVSVDELIRRACEQQYGVARTDDRRSAVRELAALSLPVGTVEEMKQESLPSPDETPR